MGSVGLPTDGGDHLVGGRDVSSQGGGVVAGGAQRPGCHHHHHDHQDNQDRRDHDQCNNLPDEERKKVPGSSSGLTWSS